MPLSWLLAVGAIPGFPWLVLLHSRLCLPHLMPSLWVCVSPLRKPLIGFEPILITMTSS